MDQLITARQKEPSLHPLVKFWDGLPREKVEYTVNRMVQVGNIKAAERPKYEDHVAVSIAQEALKGLPRVPDYD